MDGVQYRIDYLLHRKYRLIEMLVAISLLIFLIMLPVEDVTGTKWGVSLGLFMTFLFGRFSAGYALHAAIRSQELQLPSNVATTSPEEEYML